MPQKKNPDVAELARGRTGRAIGALVSMLVTLKGLPLAYNRDMQEDKFHVFSAHDTTAACLEAAEAVVRHSRFDAARLRAAAEGGLTDATALAEYLVVKGLAFREAHQIVGRLAARCVAQGRRLAQLDLPEFRAACRRIGQDVYQHLGPQNVVRRYQSEGSAGMQSLRQQLQRWRRRLR
jgi:argininosuccinate lyase